MSPDSAPSPGTGVPPLQPTSVLQTGQMMPREYELNIPDGFVYITALDGEGKELENSGFFYPAQKYKRIYGDESRYVVKKKNTLTIYNQHHYETLYRTSQQIALSTGRRCNSCGG